MLSPRKTAASVTASLKDEISMLKKELLIKDKIIQTLENKCAAFETRLADLDSRVDHGEQYSRRESVRITGIPEKTNEDVENIVMKLGEAIGADILPDMIDRAHRVGPFKPTNATPRPIICKFTGHKQKMILMMKKRKLADIDTRSKFDAEKVYINDDLTRMRAEVAAKARVLKRERKIKDTYVRNGIIFIRKLNDDLIPTTNTSHLTNL